MTQPGVLSAFADLVYPPELKYRSDPVGWARDKLNVTLWSKQREIIEAVRDHHDVAVRSCHEIGKSFVAACTVCWWLDVHPPGTAFVLTSAPTGDQVKAILWREINKLHEKGNLKGHTNLTEWYLGRELVALGRKPNEHNPTAMQGVHARYFLVVLDEASGIPPSLWNASSTLAANEHGRTLAIGNPDIPVGDFFDVNKPDSGWKVIKVGYADTPNFTGEADELPREVSEQLIHPRWVEGRRKKWGEQSALFTSKCEGEFPLMGTGWEVIPYGWAQQCRYLEYPDGVPIEGGIDVGAGGDRTIIRERRGMRAGRVEVFTNPDPMQTIGRLVEKINEWGLKRVKVDVIGIGWALVGRLKELSSKHNPTGETTHHAEIIGVNFANSPSLGLEKKYLNKRAEVWWEVGRELSRLKLWDLSSVSDEVIHELVTPEYQIVDSSGKIKVEPKDKIRERLGASPDEADALLLAFYEVNTEAAPSPGMQQLANTNILGSLAPQRGR